VTGDRPPAGYSYPAHVRDEAISLAREGFFDSEIARRLGVGDETVRRWRTKAGVVREPRRVLTDAEWADVKRRVQDGDTISAIARALDAPLSLIRRAVHDLRPVKPRTQIDELDVLRRTRAGASAREIAEDIGVTERSVYRARNRAHRVDIPVAKSPRDWVEEALCRSVDPHLYDLAADGHDADAVAKAKAICSWCPVQSDCLAWAIDARIDGVLAATTTTERRRMRTA